jgi:hypothetical protein
MLLRQYQWYRDLIKEKKSELHKKVTVKSVGSYDGRAVK